MRTLRERTKVTKPISYRGRPRGAPNR